MVAGWTLACCLGLESDGTEPAKPEAKVDVAGYLSPTPVNYRELADEVETTLRRDVLEWFPRTVDETHGGFRAEFTREWKPGTSSDGKFSVFQGRMTWIAAQVAMRRPELKEHFLPIAQHGLDYLNGTLWDKQYGGFYWGLDDQSRVNSFYTDGKHLYGTVSPCTGPRPLTRQPGTREHSNSHKKPSAGLTSTLTTRTMADTSNG